MENTTNNTTTTITIYKNYSKTSKKYYLCAKVNGEYYFINKEYNEDLYLDMDKFNGKSFDKTLFKLKDKNSKILIFKDAEEEKKYCITKEEIDKRKQERKTQSTNAFDYINDLIKEIITTNDLLCGKLTSKLFLTGKDESEDDLKPVDIDDNDLPF